MTATKLTDHQWQYAFQEALERGLTPTQDTDGWWLWEFPSEKERGTYRLFAGYSGLFGYFEPGAE